MTHTPNPAQSIASSILGSKWKPRLIVALAENGRLGFGDCKRELEDVSNKVLSNNLDDLRDHGVVSRDVVQERPRRVEYDLTTAGWELHAILESMGDWDENYATWVFPTVLLADDNPQLLELYSLWLAADYDVVTATDGQEALHLLGESIDVAILDRAMPKLRGEQVASAAVGADQRTPIGFLTAAKVSPTGVSLPADRLLRKPITKAKLLAAIEELYRLNDESPIARDVEARRHRLAFVETYLGSCVRETAPYRRAVEEVERIEADRTAATEAREPWRRLLEMTPAPNGSITIEDDAIDGSG